MPHMGKGKGLRTWLRENKRSKSLPLHELSEDLLDILDKMLVIPPLQRHCAGELLKHKYFANVRKLQPTTLIPILQPLMPLEDPLFNHPKLGQSIRTDLVGWLKDISILLHYSKWTFYHAITLVDTYLSFVDHALDPSEFQLVGISCLSLSSCYYELRRICTIRRLNKFTSREHFIPNQVLQKMYEVFRVLGYRVSGHKVPLCITQLIISGCDWNKLAGYLCDKEGLKALEKLEQTITPPFKIRPSLETESTSTNNNNNIPTSSPIIGSSQNKNSGISTMSTTSSPSSTISGKPPTVGSIKPPIACSSKPPIACSSKQPIACSIKPPTLSLGKPPVNNAPIVSSDKPPITQVKDTKQQQASQQVTLKKNDLKGKQPKPSSTTTSSSTSSSNDSGESSHYSSGSNYSEGSNYERNSHYESDFYDSSDE